MKHVLQLIIDFISSILKLLFNSTKREIQKEDKRDNFYNSKELIKKEYDENSTSSTGDGTRNLFKEYISLNKKIITKENIENELNKVLEKMFKLKIKDLPNEEKVSLKKYTKKMIVKVEKNKNRIKSIEALNMFIKTNVKKDVEEKNSEVENIFKLKEFKIEEKKVILSSGAKKEQNDKQKLNVLVTELPKEKEFIEVKKADDIFDEKIFKERKDLVEIKPSYLKKDNKSEERIIFPVFDLPKTGEDVKSQEVIKEVIEDKETDLLDEIFISNIQLNKEEVVEKDGEEKELKEINNQMKDNFENKKKINPEELKKVDKKEEKLSVIVIGFSKIKKENDQVIEKAEQEISKEDFMEKEYDFVESLLNERISSLESLLLKKLKEEEKNKVLSELKRLKTIKEKVFLYKEKDLEALRISLEESITPEELEKITLKFKTLEEDAELKQKEILIQSMQNKSEQEIKNMEKLLIKEALRKSIKSLEVPLFLSFPFIKNSFFRKFVSGLFVFRTFGFIKNILFGTISAEKTIDLSYIKRGNDALNEAIVIMEKNITTFEELKKITLLKYPELERDEEFLIYIDNLEKKLQKRYEKLLKQDKVVKKYFNKSKVLVRKKKVA